MSQFINMLKSILEGQIESNRSVLTFYGPHYPALFFSQFFAHAKKRGVHVTLLQLEDVELPTLFATLGMSFLGQKSMFWLSALQECDAAKKKQLLAYFASYKGPHTLLVWSDQALDKQSFEVPALVDQKLFQELWQLLYPEDVLSESFVQSCFKKGEKYQWDAACMLMHYMLVQDEKVAFEQSWIDKIIVPERSLFVLAQHFFARDFATFVQQWKEVEADFPPEFWTVFWSEQLWQASLFVTQALQVGPLAARKGINRLPFAFMQKDWKRYTARELCAAHNFLYGVDYGMKNGHATHGLELFLLKFVQGDFQARQVARK